MDILTQVRKLLNYTVHNWPRYWGPIITVISTVAYHLGSIYLGYPPNAVWIATFVILGTFTSGLRGGLTAALWGSAYVIYAIDDFGGVVQIIPFLFLYAAIIGWQTRRLRRSILDEIGARSLARANQYKADIFDSVTNGNVRIFRAALDVLDGLRLGWDTIPDSTRQQMVMEARAKLADLITLARGFEEMARQRGYVEIHEQDETL